MAKIIIAVLLVCGLAAGGYWYWTTTPQYSLKQLTDAVHQHNLSSFQTYCDIDSVSANAVDDLSSEAVSQAGGTTTLRRFIGLTIIGFLKPEAKTAIANSICNYVSKPAADPNASAASQAQVEEDQAVQQTTPPRREGFFARAVEGIVNKVVEAIKPPSLREVLHDMGVTKENFRGLTNFEVKDSICHVGLKFQPPDKAEMIIELELEKTGDHWHVIRLSNLANLAGSNS
ncbi:MAG: hypothetical protein K2X81_28590 [Candidatus Obscuribacterales bacterium]|nr:hypothetical protein [Candidatus Obscuribacterales bacterium]